MATGAVKLLLATSMVVLLHAASWAQDFDAGKYEYQTGCAPCHGTDGKGAGPVSSRFRVSPPDLTILAKKNNGVFPLNVVYEIIDGRKALLAHGTRDMPIWGDRYALVPKVGPIRINRTVLLISLTTPKSSCAPASSP